MDNALLKKITQYPDNATELGHIESPDFTQNTVISADIGVFHQTGHIDVEDAQEISDAEPDQDYDAGVRDGKAQSDLVYLNTISVMQNALDELQAKIGAIAADIEVSHLSAINTCLKAAVPSLVKTGTASEVQKLISEVAQTSLATGLKFKVHPDGAKDCARLCELNGQDIQVISDPSLNPAQVQLHWENGGVDLNSGDVFQSFLQKLEGLLETLNSKNNLELTDG